MLLACGCFSRTPVCIQDIEVLVQRDQIRVSPVTMPPVVEAAGLGDVPELVDVWCNSMNNAFLLKAFPHTPGGLGWLTAMWEAVVAGGQSKEKAKSRVAVARNEEGKDFCDGLECKLREARLR